MCILEPADEVIVIMPGYVSYIPQILLAEPNANVRPVDLNKSDFSIDLNKIEKEINAKTKAIIINSPNNPTGKILTREEIHSIYKLVEGKNIFVFSDEVYDSLCFTGKKHTSIGEFDEEKKQTFTINGFSKSHAMTGWRIGYMGFPDQFYDKILKIQQHVNTNTNTFIQQALGSIDICDTSHLESYKKTLL